MPPIQSTYSTNIPVGKVGHVADMTQADLVSRTAQSAIAFGIATIKGSADKTAIPFAGTGTIEGISTRDRSVQAGEQYAQYESARILIKGPIWVQASVAVAVDDQVYVTSAGAFTNSSSGNTAITGARFKTSTAGAGLALVFIK